MKNTLLSILMLLSFAQFSLAQKGRVYVAQDFKSISYSLPVDLEVNVGIKFSVKAIGISEDIDKIVIEKDGDVLVVKATSGRHRFDSDTKIYVSMPAINGISVAGSGNVLISGDINSNSFDANIAGSGDIKIESLRASKTQVNVSGSGNVRVLSDSQVKVADYRIAGSGNIFADKVRALQVEANIAGSGNIKAFATDVLKAKIAGSGNIDCFGNPKSVEKLKFGSGNINIR